MPDRRKKGKKRRGYTVEYDPDQDTDVVRYTHARAKMIGKIGKLDFA